MQNSDQLWIFCPFFCLLLTHTSSTISTIIHLSADGSVTSESELPECSVGENVNLLSYNFEKASCSTDKVCSIPLTPEAEILLHRMCSFRERCTSTNERFPIDNDQISTQLKVHYQCLDHFSTYVDMCTDTIKKEGDTIQVLSTRTIAKSEKCFCTLIGGRFTVSITDVRLMSSGKRHCSSVQLQIGFSTYACNESLNGSGSVFNKVVGERLSAINIMVENIPETFLPEKIWLTIQPEGLLTIKCNNIARRVLATSTTPNYTSSNLTSNKTGKDSSSFPVYVLIISGIPVLTIIIVGLCYIWRSRPSSDRAAEQNVKYSVVRPKEKSGEAGKNKIIEKHQTTIYETSGYRDQNKITSDSFPTAPYDENNAAGRDDRPCGVGGITIDTCDIAFK